MSTDSWINRNKTKINKNDIKLRENPAVDVSTQCIQDGTGKAMDKKVSNENNKNTAGWDGRPSGLILKTQ